ncbi:Inner membrane transporter rhtA [Raoultella terrigena]|uniref:Inner membrane transporter rhtA n=1 Tax=Raoultella terrigena TaxID=577 RepID=A0A3P8M4P7_RAOTE|nr:Inner membrane transporter rhtA [Raoultella terrigena]
MPGSSRKVPGVVADGSYFNRHDLYSERRVAGEIALSAGWRARRDGPAPGARHPDSVVIFKPWRLRFAREQRLPLLFYGLALGAMNYLFYLSIQRIPLGIAVALEFTGPLAVALFGSRRPLDFVWVVLGGSGAMVSPAAGAGRGAGSISPARCWRWAPGPAGRSIFLPASARAKSTGPATVAMGLAYCRGDFCAAGYAAGNRYAVPVVAAAAGPGDRRALYRAPLLAGK